MGGLEFERENKLLYDTALFRLLLYFYFIEEWQKYLIITQIIYLLNKYFCNSKIKFRWQK